MGAKLVGGVSWTPQVGYPKYVNADGEETLSMNYLLAADEIGDLPSSRTAFLDARFPAFLDRGFLLTRQVLTPKADCKVWLLEQEYSIPGMGSGGANPDVDEEIEYDTDEYEVPLAQLSNYRVCWDHVLLRRKGSKTTVSDSNWRAATSLYIEDYLKNDYKWAKPDDAVPEGWSVYRHATKYGVTGRLSGAGVVTVTRRAGNKGILERAMAKDYTIQTPPDTFGLSGEWLRTGSSIKKDGSKWVLVVKYRNAKKIDRDLYS